MGKWDFQIAQQSLLLASFAYPSERLREPSSSLPMVRHI